MRSLEQQSKAASDHVGETLRGIGRAFSRVNGEMLGVARDTTAGMALYYSQAATRSVLSFGLMAVGVVAAFKLVSAAVNATREQIGEMVALADKARDATVTPEFFQAFTAESRKLKVEASDLESALASAFNATKERSPIDVDKWQTGEERITAVEKALRVYNETLFRATGSGRLEGLVLFRDADNQQQKIVAVLQAMIQLNDIGQKAASLDLGEKMFGSQFVDRIRQGRTSAEELLATINTASGGFSDDLVRRSKEVDDQLKRARDTLDRELKPSWDSLANVMLTIRSIWADVIDLMAKGAAIANQFGVLGGSPLEQKRAQLKNVETLLSNGPAAFDFEQRAREQMRDNLKAEIAKLEAANIPQITVNKPSRGIGDRPTLPQTNSANDRFDTAADSVEKRTAGIQAEARTMDLLTAAREKSRIAAELETVAMQVNKEAGLGANVVTDEQRARIDAVAEAYGRAQAAIENARSPLATFARESANVGKALNQFAAQSLDGMTDALADVVTGTKTAAEAFRSMANSIISDLLRIAIRQSITGPLAGALGGLFGGGGELPGFGTSSFVGPLLPGRAAGGPVSAGQPYVVGERGPELFLPSVSGTIIPNGVRPRGGGGIVVSITSAPVFQAGMTPTDIAAIEGRLQQNNIELRQQVQADLRNAIRLDHDTLTRS